MKILDTIMDFEFDTKKTQAVHFHQNPEIIYVLDGAAEVRIESESFFLNKEDFMLINSNKSHSYREKEKELLLARFEIDFSRLSECMGTNHMLFYCNSSVDKNDSYIQLKRVLDQILSRHYDREREGRIYLNKLYYEVLYILASYCMIKSDDIRMRGEMTPDNSRIFQIQNYVQANYQKQIRLNDLADKLYLSNAYLSKYIKKHFGMSFIDYVNNIRLFHAVDELVYTDKKITRIAYDNGFPTSASFNKVFRETYDMNPSVYRKQGRQGKKDEEEEKEAKERAENKIRNYLKGVRTEKEEIEVHGVKELITDALEMEEITRPWSGIINIGGVELLLSENMRKQLLQMKQEIGFTYARVWNMFSRQMYHEDGQGDWTYNFNQIDRAFDFLILNGMKPYIELSFKPRGVSYTINYVLREEENDVIFHDRESYEKVMTAFVTHLVNRYGIGEVKTWYFELWKDERLNMQDEKGQYFDCFEIGAGILKKFSPEIKAGGAGFAMGYDRHLYRTLIRNWKKRKIKPDFISVYSYSYELVQQNGVYFGRRSLDNNFIKNQVDIFKKILKEEDFIPDEFHITEWNFTISNRNCVNDSCAKAAYVMKSCMESIGNVDMMGYWHGSDLYTECYDTEGILYGDSGLLTRDGIKKPSYYALHFMNFVRSKLLGKNENALVSTDGNDCYTIVCHNCKQFSYRYSIRDEKDIRIEEIGEMYEDGDAIHLKFGIHHVRTGEYTVRMFYVNQEYGSIQNAWRDMGYMKNLSRGEILYLLRVAEPKVELRKMYVTNGVLRLDTRLLAHEIKLIDIRYNY